MIVVGAATSNGSLASSPPKLDCYKYNNPLLRPKSINLTSRKFDILTPNRSIEHTMAAPSENPLLSNARASDSSPVVQLHPLVLLTISDCITRHTLRQIPGPVVGAIIGQQNGQEITMEVAFQAKLKASDNGDIVLDDEWFSKRLDDCTDSA